MMIHAYDEEYVSLAQRVMGDMFDFAVITLGFAADRFADLFMNSDIARQIERGNPKYIAGHNGCELARLVLEQSGVEFSGRPDDMFMDKSPEFWAGWSLAFFQWTTNSDFRWILSIIPFSEIIKMYSPYHEASVEKFVSALNDRILQQRQETRLQYYRRNLGLSQSELARESGVPLRQIQLFEQRQRDISRTQAETLLKLSKALHCSMESLLH